MLVIPYRIKAGIDDYLTIDQIKTIMADDSIQEPKKGKYIIYIGLSGEKYHDIRTGTPECIFLTYKNSIKFIKDISGQYKTMDQIEDYLLSLVKK